MAFVTGMILMYIPEEPAFRLLTRLMDERGANLRQLYLPGLEGLKNYLRMFEWLMDRIHPELREHLEVGIFLHYGVRELFCTLLDRPNRKTLTIEEHQVWRVCLYCLGIKAVALKSAKLKPHDKAIQRTTACTLGIVVSGSPNCPYMCSVQVLSDLTPIFPSC